MYSLDFPFAYGQPNATAEFRSEPEDFQVDEADRRRSTAKGVEAWYCARPSSIVNLGGGGLVLCC